MQPSHRDGAVGGKRVGEGPEGLAVVHVSQVRHFVGHNVVLHEGRGHDRRQQNISTPSGEQLPQRVRVSFTVTRRGDQAGCWPPSPWPAPRATACLGAQKSCTRRGRNAASPERAGAILPARRRRWHPAHGGSARRRRPASRSRRRRTVSGSGSAASRSATQAAWSLSKATPAARPARMGRVTTTWPFLASIRRVTLRALALRRQQTVAGPPSS